MTGRSKEEYTVMCRLHVQVAYTQTHFICVSYRRVLLWVVTFTQMFKEARGTPKQKGGEGGGVLCKLFRAH